jgi:hypothetical protein
MIIFLYNVIFVDIYSIQEESQTGVYVYTYVEGYG